MSELPPEIDLTQSVQEIRYRVVEPFFEIRQLANSCPKKYRTPELVELAKEAYGITFVDKDGELEFSRYTRKDMQHKNASRKEIVPIEEIAQLTSRMIEAIDDAVMTSDVPD